MRISVEISRKTIFFIAAFIALLWALYQIREVIILLFIAIIFMSAFSPLVEFLQKLKIPKVLSIALIYIVIVAIFALLITLVITPLSEQTSSLVQAVPHLYQQILPSQYFDHTVLEQQLGDFSTNALTLTLNVFSNFLAFITVLVLTFYLLLERDHLNKLLSQFFIGQEARVKKVTGEIEDKLGGWVRGQLVLSGAIGTTVFIILSLFDIPYALPLAILAAFMEMIPVIGPIISAIPGIIVAFTVSPVTALFVGLAYFVIQQAESHFIVPQLMKKAVGLNPLVVILAIAIGGKLLGIQGALIAVPATVVLQIITEDFLREKS